MPRQSIGSDPASIRSDIALLSGRVLLVLALLPNGLRKIFDFHAIAAGIGGTPQMLHGQWFPATHPLFFLPFPGLFLALSTIMDIGASLCVIAGWRTRTAAALLAGYCVIVTVIYHYEVANPENLKAVVRNLSLIGGLLVVAGAGAGRWSLDFHQARAPQRPIDA